MAKHTPSGTKAVKSGPALVAEAVKTHPGIAELVKLYERHAEAVRRATPYLRAPDPTVNTSLSNSSA